MSTNKQPFCFSRVSLFDSKQTNEFNRTRDGTETLDTLETNHHGRFIGWKRAISSENVMMAKSVDENGEKLRANEKWHGIGSLCESLGSNLNWLNKTKYGQTYYRKAGVFVSLLFAAIQLCFTRTLDRSYSHVLFLIRGMGYFQSYVICIRLKECAIKPIGGTVFFFV